MAKYCKDCGAEMNDANFCPNCGSPPEKNETKEQPVQKKVKRKPGCFIAILALVVVFGGSGVIFALQNNTIQKMASGVKNASEYITMGEYNQIETGMTYEAVQKIVGSPGEISSQVEMAGFKNVIVTWYGDGLAGSNANVTFMNGKVQGKAQVGLK